VYISAAVVWEMVIKHGLGKLKLPSNPLTYVPSIISHEHVLTVEALPNHHSDPFDRMLVAQARFEEMTLISTDRNLARYAVQYLVV